MDKSSLGEKEIADMLIHTTLKAPIGMTSIRQLQLLYTQGEDLQEIKYILGDILNYPSTQAAYLHRNAYRLGSLDLDQSNPNRLDFQDLSKLSQDVKFCPCCGFIKQYDQIKLTTHLHEVQNLGISTYLYFNTLRTLAYALVIMAIIYCLYAIITNAIASGKYHTDEKTQEKYRSNGNVLAISLGSKQLNPTPQNVAFYDAQAWIGVALLVLWAFFFIFRKGKQKQAEIKQQQEAFSAADFSIMIEGIPKLSKSQVQRQLDDYFKEVRDETFLIKGFNVQKYNVGKPFYLNEERFDDPELQQMNKQYAQKLQVFAEWIKERQDKNSFSEPQQNRDREYQNFDRLKEKRFQKYKAIAQDVMKQFEAENENPTTTAFVTFGSNYEKNIFLSFNNNSISAKLRYYLKCCSGSSNFYLKDSNGQYVETYISQAPQPEDIIWTNLGRTKGEMIKKRIITFLITFLLLGASFGIVYGLSAAQLSNKSNTVLSFIISLFISLTNMIIQQVLRFITLYQRDFTQTSHQTSLGLKAVMALLLNSILIPIMVNYFLQDNLYGPNGLAYDVFMLSITNSFLAPVLKIFDMSYFFSRIMAWYKNRPTSKITLNQTELNTYNEYVKFQVGYEYIYLINNFLFAAFFVSLQPIIVVFTILGYFLMYWAQKYYIFSRCSRPVPGTNLVNTAMFQLIYLGPLFYTIGCFCWSHFFPEGTPARAFVAHLVSLILSIVIFLLPFETVSKYVFSDKDEEQMNFQEYKIFLPSQYDRLNPATARKAIKQHLEYIKVYRQNLKASGQKNIERTEKKFLKQIRQGFHVPSTNLLPNFGFQSNMAKQNNFIVDQIFRGEQNVINPLLVGQSIIPNFNKNMPNLFEKLAGGGRNNPQDVIFRKVNSLLQDGDQFQRNDQAMLQKSGFNMNALLGGQRSKRNFRNSAKYDNFSSNIYQPSNAYNKIFSLEQNLHDKMNENNDKYGYGYQGRYQGGNQGYPQIRPFNNQQPANNQFNNMFNNPHQGNWQ